MDSTTWATELGRPLAQLAERLSEHAPALLGPLALLLIGWILARLLRTWTSRLLARLDRRAAGRAVQTGLRRLGVDRQASEVVSGVVFWVVFLFFVTAATESLGLPVLATWLGGLSLYLPRVLVAALIVLAGLLAGNLAREAIVRAMGAAGVAFGDLLGRVVQVTILLVAGVTAVDQLGIDSRFLTATITIVIGSVIGGVALAFGLGARTAVSNIIAIHYLRQVYRVGQTIRMGTAQGRIVDITSTAVVLDCAEGRVVVPGREFSRTASVLLTAGS